MGRAYFAPGTISFSLFIMKSSIPVEEVIDDEDDPYHERQHAEKAEKPLGPDCVRLVKDEDEGNGPDEEQIY